MIDTDLLTQFEKYKAEIKRVLDKTTGPHDQVPDADVRDILETLKQIGALGKKLRASVVPKPERPDPLSAGAKVHAIATAAIEASGGKMSWTAAMQHVCLNHWDLVREWQQSVQAPRRRR
jgi:hypothetical protein